MNHLNRGQRIVIAYTLLAVAMYFSWIQRGWYLRFGILILANLLLFVATVRTTWSKRRLLILLSFFQLVIFSLSAILFFNPTYRPEYRGVIEMINDGRLSISPHGEVFLPDNLQRASITRSVYTAELGSDNLIIFFPMASGKGWDVGGYLFARYPLSDQQMQNGVDIKLWEMYGLRSPVRLRIRWKLSGEWYIVGHST